MPVLTQTALAALIDEKVPTNGANGVTAALVRDVMDALNDAIHANPYVRTLESFGAVATPFDTSGSANDAAAAVDNLTAIQAAVDWSSSTGGVVLMGAGVYGFSGTIRLKNDMALVGRGRNVTKLQQLDTSWPTCMAPVANSPSTSDGVAYVTLVGFTLHGGWNLQKNISTSGNWRNFTIDEMVQVGIHIKSPSSGTGDLVPPPRSGTGSEDAFNMIDDVAILRVAGTGMIVEGRGEMFISRLRIAGCATDGMTMSSVDNWMSDVTIHVCGNRGFGFNGGNQRISDFKAWFIGMMVTNEPMGYGIEMEGSNMTNLSLINISTQDTYGPGIRMRGNNYTLTGAIDEVSGGRLIPSGLGFQGTRTRSNSALEIIDADNCQITLAMTGADRGRYPALVHLNGSSIFDNDINLLFNKRQSTPWWNTSTPILVAAGYTNAKCYNQIKVVGGGFLHGHVASGTLSAGRLADATDHINTYKYLGFKVPVADGRWATKTGSAATSPWRIDDGSTVTPA